MGRKVSQKAKSSAVRVKKITRAQALSYNRTIPNGIGVTAISAVNGRGSYSEFQKNRYEQTLQVLQATAPRAAKKNKDGSMKRRPVAAGFRYRPVMPNKGTVRLPSMAKFADRQGATQRIGETPSIESLRAQAQAARAFEDAETRRFKRRGRAAGKTRVYQPKKKKAAAKTRVYRPKTVKMKSSPKKVASKKVASKKVASKKVASKKVASKKVASKKVASKRPAAKRASSYRPLMARAGGRKFKTFLYHPGGRAAARKIPSWVVAGAAAPRKMSEAQRKRLAKRRSEIAKRISRRIRAGTYPFTPNVTFSQWAANMKKSKKKAKKKSGKKLYGAAKAAHEKAQRRKKAASARKAKASKKVSRRPKRARKTRTGTVKMSAAPRRRRRKASTKKVARRGKKRMSASTKAKLASYKRRKKAGKKGKKGSRRMRRNGSVTSYISNLGVGQTADQLVAVIKQGAIIAGGLAAHKVLTNLVVENVDFFKTMPYGKSVAALAVAAIGVPVSTKFVAGMGSQLAVGMGASLVHTVLVDVLSKMGQSQAASYLGDYTEAGQPLPAAGYGSYYEFSPGQTYAGMGEYIETGASGFGDYMQAAAGMGDVMQAAAGFGSPALMQAAAGVGEYIVSGAQGIGEYEQVAPEYTAPAALSEGIHPSLSAAEQALSIAEAAAGVNGMGMGNVDASLQQIVYPRGQALDIDDQPGGSRAGVFTGGNGVFGP